MNHTATEALPAAPIAMAPPKRWGNWVFETITLLAALMIVVIFVLVAYVLIKGAMPTIKEFGWSFLISKSWNPVTEKFGAWPFIYGTLLTSFIALLIAVPLSVGTAVFLTDLAPVWLRQPLSSVIEMLAAVPSIIWGLWGLFVLVPWLQENLFQWLTKYVGPLPVIGALFQGPVIGPSILAAGIIVAIMILPIVTSVSREILRSVPDLQREAAYGLGATRWEVTRIAVLSYAKRGLMGAAVLGLGRALGETMAVTMVIGNSPRIETSILQPGYTLASVIANQFNEAMSEVHRSVLYEIGLVLVGVTILVNIGALLLIKSVQSPGGGPHLNPMATLSPHAKYRKMKSGLMSLLSIVCAITVVLPLLLVFVYLMKMGFSSLNWNFFTQLPKPAGEEGGGMANAIVGTLELMGLALVIGAPIGLLGGIYLAEYGSDRVGGWIRFGADVLNGVPSIVWGMVGYMLIVMPMKGYSALAGGIALSFIMVPLVLRTTEEMLLLVPTAYREAGLALGIPRWVITVRIVLRTAFKGILTGVLLALGRIAGETAPLIFTALGTVLWNNNLKEPIAALPLMVYNFAISPFPDQNRQAWAGALVLIFLVFLLSAGVRVISMKRKTS